MKPYSSEELSKAVYYPACGDDLRPILAFSHISNLFIYVDRGMCWSESIEQFTDRMSRTGEESNGQDEIDSTQSTASAFAKQFKPIGNEEIERRIKEVQASELTGLGLKEILHDKQGELGELLAPESLELVGEKTIPFDSVGSMGIDKITENCPFGFEMNPDEQQWYEEKITHPFESWARELTFRRRIGNHERLIRLLYIAGEGVATYCSLFESGKIAPQVLITIRSGRGFAKLEDPEGITARLLNTCQKKPLLWVKGGTYLRPNPEDGLYNTLVQKYMEWSAEAFTQQDQDLNLCQEVKIPGGRQLSLRHQELSADDIDSFDRAFVTQSAADRNQGNWPESKLSVFPSFMSLPKALEWVDTICQENGYEYAVMMPCGHEDEGVIFHDWVAREGLPDVLEVRFTGEFDFADLRGF